MPIDLITLERFSVRCDGCGAHASHSKTKKGAEHWAREIGWFNGIDDSWRCKKCHELHLIYVSRGLREALARKEE